mgnify:CR=1 FL=1
MTHISSHVLDTAVGRPAASVRIHLDRLEEGGSWTPLAAASTGDDGRVADLAPGVDLLAATYRLRFETGAYLERANRPVFYPWIEIVFRVDGEERHYHIPLLLSSFGYSTYRGS